MSIEPDEKQLAIARMREDFEQRDAQAPQFWTLSSTLLDRPRLAIGFIRGTSGNNVPMKCCEWCFSRSNLSRHHHQYNLDCAPLCVTVLCDACHKNADIQRTDAMVMSKPSWKSLHPRDGNFQKRFPKKNI